MNEAEIFSSILLNAVPDIGPARFSQLIKLFGNAEKAVRDGVKAWGDVPLFDEKTLRSVEVAFSAVKQRAQEDWALCRETGVSLYFNHVGPYPPLLRQIAHPPPLLYVIGDDISANVDAISIVGSRRCSYYGEKMARRLAQELAAHDIVTVSGLARGIDTHVHSATIEAGGRTWAVVGSGLLSLYPPENKALCEKLKKQGAIVSEFPLRTRPHPANFPRRNRIIAGLSRGTVVVEGGERSGSLITARLAAEEGRDVFAVPGPATSELSVAPNRLLQQGAVMAQSGADILSELGRLQAFGEAPVKKKSLPADYSKLLDILGEEPVAKEILAQRLNRGANQLSSLLLEMEMKGLIRTVPGGGVLKS